MTAGSYCFDYYGTRVVVDLEGQRLKAEVDDRAGLMERPPPRERLDREGVDLAGGIPVFPQGHTWQAPLYPSVAAAGVTRHFTPLFAMAAKAKAFDDRLNATIERLAHDGAGAWPGVYQWLSRLRDGLEPGSKARGLLDAAAHLAGEPLPDRGPPRLRARKFLAPFLEDAKVSLPVGVYAESDELRTIFRHDRLLQSELKPPEAAVLRDQLEAAPKLLDSYRRHLELTRRLTGGFACASVLDRDARKGALLPASDSAESRLMKQLFTGRSIPDGFELARELIVRIRDGRLRTEPTGDDGWYAHTFHAAAALLSPETEGLEIGPRYRHELEQTFQALFALNRETHVKQLESPAAGGAPLTVAPRITVEPAPAYYERVANGYRYLSEQLASLLGDAVLGSVAIGEELSLADGLAEMETLFAGAGVACREELGQPNDAAGGRVARAAFRSWQQRSKQDPDLAEDMRVAVPAYYDIERKTVRVCATLGVETRTLRIEFVDRPEVRVVAGSSRGLARGEPFFMDTEVLILSPITLECDVEMPLTRAELRELCDRHQEPAAIKAALEA